LREAVSSGDDSAVVDKLTTGAGGFEEHDARSNIAMTTNANPCEPGKTGQLERA